MGARAGAGAESAAPMAARPGAPGPAFGAVPAELLEETLMRLAAENERRAVPRRAARFKEAPVVEFVFLLAEKWHLEQAARYQAVEILERFMIKHVEQTSRACREGGKSGERGQAEGWSSRQEAICDSFVLRLVSCVQLASKLSLHYKIVNSDTALQFLQSLKYSYTKQELLESELAVLKALHFQINVSTPLTYVELLLEVLGHNGCLLPAEPLHDLCVHVLDFSYLTREAIYETLLQIAIENCTPSRLQVAKFLAVKEDFMLLAVGVISTSAFILNPKHWNQVVQHLNCITGITSQSILEFSYAVLTHILGSSSPEQHCGNHGAGAQRRELHH